MKKYNLSYFAHRLISKKEHYPWSGQIELTYRCNLDCIHCYCKGSEDKDRELTTMEWKKILDEIHREGCVWLTFTGGEPLVRDDFLELYSYAKKKGFIITLFTNGQAYTEKIVDYLVKSPPFSIEITLNGITKNTYETITRVEGSFERVMATIREFNRKDIRLILKSNCLKQNKHEIVKVKAWTEENLGKLSKNKYRFKYDPMIYPRLNGDKMSCDYRLSFEEIKELRKQDADIWEEYRRGIKADFPDLRRNRRFLYRCDSWTQQFFIDPYGKLKFCHFSEKFSTDLKTDSFKEGFYNTFPRILDETFKTDSKCKDCELRAICYHCPARAYLETGDEEVPVPYYCELAEALGQELQVHKLSK